ncbi:hypothetical protein LXA43DRAFT_904799 [Ganoderma leucocontextum]|nr:hypothetical protein LXA43DRAFT_904799 [Ganoderma leucocontextum]
MKDNFAFESGQLEHRRGHFAAVASGISYGGGQRYPKNMNMSPHNAAVMDTVLQDPDIKRIANFGTMLQTFHPRLHADYTAVLQTLMARDSNLSPNFANNAFAAASFNLGPKTVSFRHLDSNNVPHGQCAITALGRYDHTKGGHIVLWSLRMVIQFPPSATILILSAIVPHSNTILTSEDEFRQSFTQYSAGGLHRWVACGHQSQKDFERQGRRFDISGEERWRRGLSLLSKWSEYAPTDSEVTNDDVGGGGSNGNSSSSTSNYSSYNV